MPRKHDNAISDPMKMVMRLAGDDEKRVCLRVAHYSGVATLGGTSCRQRNNDETQPSYRNCLRTVRISPRRLYFNEFLAQLVYQRALTEVHIGCAQDEQVRWLHEAWTTCEQLAASGVDVRAMTAWALLGSSDCTSAAAAQVPAGEGRWRSPHRLLYGELEPRGPPPPPPHDIAAQFA